MNENHEKKAGKDILESKLMIFVSLEGKEIKRLTTNTPSMNNETLESVKHQRFTQP